MWLHHRVLLAIAAAAVATAQTPPSGDTPVFRSDVTLIRVDVQVVDRANHPITGLSQNDFVLREQGQSRKIVNFASEDMPVDVLFLLDVSGSMRPHVESLASAAQSAFRALTAQDRSGVMVFDRQTRIRAPFRQVTGDSYLDFERVLDRENFNGGTDITRAMYDAVRYVSRNARHDARRAIVILTDDRTEFQRDDRGVLTALAEADTVLSALIAPDAMGQFGGGFPGRRSGGGWGSIILGGGGRFPRGGPSIGIGNRGRSAGTSEIAEQSGGDSVAVNHAMALETTLLRIRQRYALYFQAPAGSRAGENRDVTITLASAASRRFPDADLRYRGHYQSVGSSGPDVSDSGGETPVVVSSSEAEGRDNATAGSSSEPPAARPRRRVAVDEPTSRAPVTAGTPPSSTTPAQVETAAPVDPNKPRRGWRRVGDPEPASVPPPEPDPVRRRRNDR